MLSVWLVTSLSGSQQASAKPDFSGKWVSVSLDPLVISSRTSEATPGIVARFPLTVPSFGGEFTAQQTESGLTIQRPFKGDVVKTFYGFDHETMNHEAVADTVSTTTWQGQTLQIVTKLGGSRAGTGGEVRRRLGLNPDGTLSIETVADPNPKSVSIYKRAKVD
jgi:hypothetical protein